MSNALQGIQGQDKHEILCERFKAKKIVLHTIPLGVGGSIYTSHAKY